MLQNKNDAVGFELLYLTDTMAFFVLCSVVLDILKWRQRLTFKSVTVTQGKWTLQSYRMCDCVL